MVTGAVIMLVHTRTVLGWFGFITGHMCMYGVRQVYKSQYF